LDAVHFSLIIRPAYDGNFYNHMSQIGQDDIARLFDKSLVLDSDAVVLRLQFSSRGSVAVSSGLKNGPVVHPVVRWSLKKGRLIIYDEKPFLGFLWMVRGQVLMEWTGIRFDGNTVTAKLPSGSRTYTIQQPGA
jgi:hypothetical protein